MEIGKDWAPHASHKMGKWRRTIVTLIATSRFGRLRKCKGCEAEQAETVCGRAAHEELDYECEGA